MTIIILNSSNYYILLFNNLDLFNYLTFKL